jgi:predicted alpha/beta hydrolase family esterase
MTAIATLPFSDPRLSIVTVGDGEGAPAWQRMFGWPAGGSGAVPLDARSPGARNIWAAKLDRAVREADARVLLVAEGLGCAASAWWARLSPAHDVRKVAGALLFAPPAQPDGLFASPRSRLPFPSLVIRPGGMADDLAAAVEDWGSRLVVGDRVRDRHAGAVAWRQAQRLFLRLTQQMVEHDVDRVRAITGWR